MTILELQILLNNNHPDYSFGVPPKAGLGILSTSGAFKKAKVEGRNPVDIATSMVQEIAETLRENNVQNYFTVSNVGPYVNIEVTSSYINYTLQQSSIANQIPNLDKTDSKLSIDMYQLNAAKQPHIGHIRGGNIGEALRRVLLLKHRTVVSDRHLGDWGVQFGLVVWGINNQSKYNLTVVDWDEPDQLTRLQQLEALYVEVNKLTAEDPNVRKEAQTICHQLEDNLLSSSSDVDTWEKIVRTSLPSIENASKVLNLNQLGFWNEVNAQYAGKSNWSVESQNVLSDKKGVWELNLEKKEFHHDIDLSESFLYGYFVQEIAKWSDAGIVSPEPGETGKTKYFIDLEEEGLGRCHLMSSDGYTTYMFRDVVTRFIAAGLLEIDKPLLCVDYRQSHSLKQSMAVIKRIADSGFYDQQDFPLMNSHQTARAVANLKTEPTVHVSNGYLILTTGAMSSRKGNVLHFSTLMEMLGGAVRNTLEEKDYGDVTDQKVLDISIAALKWADLSKDREADVTFDVNAVTKFEGNTGVYQLYTYARLNNILKKSEFDPSQFGHNLDSDDYQELLNSSEIDILKKTYQLPFVLETICSNYKPHTLCNYIFDLTSQINTWYAKNNVLQEPDAQRKQVLLQFIELLKNHLGVSLQLLGIEPLESM